MLLQQEFVANMTIAFLLVIPVTDPTDSIWFGKVQQHVDLRFFQVLAYYLAYNKDHVDEKVPQYMPIPEGSALDIIIVDKVAKPRGNSLQNSSGVLKSRARISPAPQQKRYA
jgi:hypothetical protein